MKYVKAIQGSLVILVLAILGLSVAIKALVHLLPVIIVVFVVIVIGGVLIGRRSPF